MGKILEDIGEVIKGVIWWAVIAIVVLFVIGSLVAVGTVAVGVIAVIVVLFLIIGGMSRLFGIKSKHQTIVDEKKRGRKE